MPGAPSHPSRLSIGIISLLVLLIFGAMACLPVDAGPEEAENNVGEVHEVTAEVDPEENEPWLAFFLIIFGPNEGKNSLLDCSLVDEVGEECLDELEGEFEDCDPGNDEEALECLLEIFGDQCEPSCAGEGDSDVSWTYLGDGGTGTDYIVMCAFDLSILEEENAFDAIDSLSSQAGASQLVEEEPTDEDIELIEEELGCDVVQKTWVEGCPLDEEELDELDQDELENVADEADLGEDEFEDLCDVEFDEDEGPDDEPRFLGGGVVGVFPQAADAARANRERAAAAAAAAAATPRPAAASVRPPSTGDGGIK